SSSLISDSVSVRLSNETLWKQFNSLNTEMVVTKNGRKMFPKIEYVIEGLDENQHYALFLHIERINENRYKYVSGEWVSCGKADTVDTIKKVGHQDGVLMGSAWMRSPVSFDRVKITNNTMDSSPSNICLTSMCKYRPILSIFKMDSPIHSSIDTDGKQFVLSVTEFIAVTAYQNQSITNLKIAHNPFAKGFREGGAVDRKRSSTSPPSGPSPKRSPSSLSNHSTTSLLSLPSLPINIPPTTVSSAPTTPTVILPDLKMSPFQLPYPHPLSLPLYSSLLSSSPLSPFNPFLLSALTAMQLNSSSPHNFSS
ncbi:hypothetical protein PFISCL1PPCAC_10353, partial [Pristionchus fissidentatus]